MEAYRAVLYAGPDSRGWTRDIMSKSVAEYIFDLIDKTGGILYIAGDFCAPPPASGARLAPTVDDCLTGDGPALAFVLYAPAPTISPGDLNVLLDHAVSRAVCLRSSDSALIAAAGKCAALRGLKDLSRLAVIQTAPLPVVRDPHSFSRAQRIIQARVNDALMDSGVYLAAPDSTFISPDARIGPGCEVLPNCQILGHTSIGAGSVIGPNCLISNAKIGPMARVNASQIYDSTVGEGTSVGPFAYIRPGCEIGARVKIGDFVELKKAKVGEGTKISHLSYIGDSELGERVNIGCGVVTVNYDGKLKHKTVVGDGSFVGCNVNLVAPLSIGNDTYLAAGSTITNAVESGALAIARARQSVKPEWVRRRKAQGKI